MIARRCHNYFQTVLAGTLLYGLGGLSSIGYAQVATNITPGGLGTSVNGSITVGCTGGTCNITGGTRPGNGPNLFHSFGNFSLDTANSASFLNDSGLPTTNILSRVTGGNPSSIFGTINTLDFSGANLFLMNPAGIVFGPTAQLNVSGSFHATTADYVKLGSDGIFYADPTRPTVLSVAPPSAFGFLATNPAPIDVQTGGFDPDTFEFKGLLSVPEGQTLSLVGGTVNLGAPDGSAPGYLAAPGGRINLIGMGQGEATLDDANGFNLNALGPLGAVNIRGGSFVDAKDVFIRGGRLVLNESIIFPGALGFPPDGGQVSVQVTNDVTISGTTFEPLTQFPPGIVTFAGSPETPQLFPDAKVPDISIDAQSVLLSGFAALQNIRFGPGAPGNIEIKANTIRLENGAGIAISNNYEGFGGNIVLDARKVELSSDGSPGALGAMGLTAQSFIHPFFRGQLDPTVPPDVDPRLTRAEGGNITVKATESLSIFGDAVISTDSFSFGKSGDITIDAGDVFLTGTGPVTGAIGAQSFLVGNSGNVTINATGRIEVGGGFRITTSTGGSGNAGNVQITAGQPVTLSGTDSRILNSATQPSDETLNNLYQLGLFGGEDFASLKSATGIPNADLFDVLALLRSRGDIVLSDSELLPGNAGSVSVNTPLLTMNGGTRIETSTGWGEFDPVSGKVVGNAGNVAVNVGSLFLNDGASIRSRSGAQTLTGELLVGAGNGGSITVAATDTISIAGSSPSSGEGSAITTTTFGDGAAGNISLSANQVEVQSGGGVTSESGGTVNGQLFVGTGNAGQISVSTPTLIMANGAISVATSGAGNAGSILLNGNTLSLTGGSRVVSSTTGSGQGGSVAATAGESIFISGSGSGLLSTASSTGNAGQITVSAPTLTMGESGTISVATSGAGNAGNISLNVNSFTQAGGSQVVSSTTSAGQGGNVTVTASESASLSGFGSGLFSTTSSTGNAGEITVSTPTLAMSDGGTISVATSGAGNAGNISLNVNSFTQTGGAQVVSSTTSAGQGGNLTLAATESTSFSGLGSGLFSTAGATGAAGQIALSTPTLAMSDGGAISAATEGSGAAGNISLSVNSLNLATGAQVLSSTTGDGAGGTVAVTAGESISISGSGILPSGLFSTASSTGNAGQITVATPTLTMGDSGTISVATEGTGNAGNIALNVSNLTQTGGAQVVSSTTGAGAGGNLTVTAATSIAVSGSGSEPSGLFSTASSTGNAGEITVTTPTLTMGDGGTISVATSGAGNAGNVLLNVNNFGLTGGAQIVSSTSGAGQGGSVTANATNSASISGTGTGLFSTASGSGAGGTINIQADQLQIADAGVVSANSTGTATATAGNVNIVAGELVQMQNGSITTESSLADGGNISITTTGSLVRLTDSQITTSVESGVGTGGNIIVNSDHIVLDDSQILANAFGGPGGNINLTADVFLVNSGGQSPISLAGIVEASSALSTPGTINIEAAVTDVSGTVAQLPEAPLQATELLRAACAARFVGGKASSLVVGGRDGLPLQPGGLIPSPLYAASEADKPSTISSSTGFSPPTGFSLLGSSDRNLNRYSLLPNFKCSL